VPKVQHKPIKVQERVQIKRAKDNPKTALVWRTGLSGAPPDSVRCTREFHSELATVGNSGRPLRYNSPDCSLCQAEQWSSTPMAVCNATVKRYSARLRAQKSEQAQMAHRTLNMTCLVHHQTVRCTTGLSGGPLVRSSNGRTLTAW
jgi:hypothetical protein